MNLKYQQEFISQVKSECQSLIELHWEEIALYKDKIKLNPDWESYHTYEENNLLRIFTARNEDVLVGYFVAVLQKNMHYKDHIFACNDILYLHEDYRKGFAGIHLLKFAEEMLKEDGVSVMLINTKIHKPLDKILERLKFNPIERVYSKYLGSD